LSQQQARADLAFIYDIPRSCGFTSKELTEHLNTLGYLCEVQIANTKSESVTPFLSARVKFECEAHYHLALMRHPEFTVRGGRTLRMVPFDPNFSRKNASPILNPQEKSKKSSGQFNAASLPFKPGQLDLQAELNFQKSNVFVKGLDRTWTSEILLEIFDMYGDIKSAKVSVYPVTGKSKGYGFVCFTTEAAAKKVIEAS
jgi:hypothetical protein